MELKIKDVIVGDIYFNLALHKKEFLEILKNLQKPLGESLAELKIGKLKLDLELDGVKCNIQSYRKYYYSDDHIYFEGTILTFKN